MDEKKTIWDVEFNNLQAERAVIYKNMKKLFAKTNIRARYSRNSICFCGSGKKWKNCCVSEHEKEVLEVEKLTNTYKNLTIKAINLKRKMELV